MTKTYEMVATVKRNIEDTINILVDAETESSAYRMVRSALETFPEGHPDNPLGFCLVTDRKYSRPFSVTIERVLPDEDYSERQNAS